VSPPAAPAPAAAAAPAASAAAGGSSSPSSSSVSEQQRSSEASDAAKVAGNLCLGRGDLVGAEAKYSEALALDPANSAALNNRALCRLKVRDWRGACLDAAAVLALEPHNAKALYRQAVSLEELGQTAQALNALTALLEMEPSNKDALGRRGRLEKKARAAKRRTSAKAEGAAHGTLQTPKRESLEPKAQGGGGDAAAAAPKMVVAKAEPLISEAPPQPAAPPATTAAAAAAAAPSPQPKVTKTVPSKLAASPQPKIRIKAAVPTDPPKSMYELERVWRSLKDQPNDRARYLCGFKQATYKKAFKPCQAPDLLSEVVEICATTLATGQGQGPGAGPGVGRDLAACCRVLKGLAKTAGFDSMTKLLLSEGDKAHVRVACAALAARPKYAQDAQDLASAFGV